ncbi:hypothetical protein [Rosistilla oblonga]|uniref:hypothetical protein n=1 Tax=Rosistilla oblonga TaxID=2527990 RepID=UPI003A96E493
MAVRILGQFSFDRGEISPKYAGNVDLENYQRSLAMCENFIVLPQGMLTRRPGTHFVTEVKDSSKKVRLIPFEYSALDTYIQEWGENYIRFYRDFGQVLNDSDETYEVTTTYSEAQIPETDYEQVSDTLYLANSEKSPATLERVDHDDWTLTAGPTITTKPAEWTGTNWPKYVTQHQQRLCFAATPAKPRKMWLSMTPNTSGPRLLTFTTGTADDNALVFDIVGTGEMQWLASGRALYLGTTDETRTVSGSGGFYEPITPNSILNRDHANERSSNIKPVRLNNSLFFVSLSRKRLHEFSYAFEDDAFNAPDITKWSEHIAGSGTENGIVQIAITRDPVPIIWGCRDDGQLIGMTYDREAGVYAWHRHKIGGTFDGNPWGKVESIATAFMGGRDVLWMVVARTINGETKRYIEYMDPFHDPVDSNDIASARYLDSCISYTEETPLSEFTDGQHLESEEVQVFADGVRLPAQTMAESGTITLPSGKTATEVLIGYNAPSYAQTLPFDPGSAQGTGASKPQKLLEASINLLNSQELQIGRDIDSQDRATFMTSQTQLGTVPELFTGYKKLPINGNKTEAVSFVFSADGPLPCNVRSFTLKLETGS